MEEEERICSACGKPMNKGYCIEGGMEYYCCDECLRTAKTNLWNCTMVAKVTLIGPSGMKKAER